MKMKRRLAKTDSTKAEEAFGDVKGNYRNLRTKMLEAPGSLNPQGNEYIRKLDSLKHRFWVLKQIKWPK